MRGLTGLAALVLVVAIAAGCGSGSTASSLPQNVQLAVDTSSTGGKALVISAKTAKKLAAKKGALYTLELRGIEPGSGDSFDHPSYVDQNRCVGGGSCEWTVAPAKAGTYEYRAVLLDNIHDTTAGESNAVKVGWTAPPRPRSIRLFVNGKTPPSVPLTADHYSDFPAGPMQAEAKWTSDARGSGYYLTISDDYGLRARCSAGTSCRVAKPVPLPAGAEDSWTVELLTTKGDKVADGFKVCVEGRKS
jgi:hypothetical protein